jgi:hypothetical protein
MISHLGPQLALPMALRWHINSKKKIKFPLHSVAMAEQVKAIFMKP